MCVLHWMVSAAVMEQAGKAVTLSAARWSAGDTGGGGGSVSWRDFSFVHLIVKLHNCLKVTRQISRVTKM